jgi:hypothetical protein
VSNKDLFCTLDEAVSRLERHSIDVGFWWIDRQVHTVWLIEILPLLTVSPNVSLIREPIHSPKRLVRESSADLVIIVSPCLVYFRHGITPYAEIHIPPSCLVTSMDCRNSRYALEWYFLRRDLAMAILVLCLFYLCAARRIHNP